MYTLNCTLINSVSNVCRQLTASLKTNGICATSALQRTLSSSAVRLHDTKESATTSNESSTFSQLPPLPGQDSPLRWAGKSFEELPIAHIKATYNNTHIQVTDSEGKSMVRTSCGTEGFRNIKKSTPIAAQTAGISAAAKATAKGLLFVRVVIKGLGPGRLSAIKGLTMGGLEVVSITDNTPVPHNGCRPRKARRM
ncbi:small ribosomal subunit protein uS11m [Takifugu rubripes]|uniref:Small ribosomal subunit protein uS11m n=1 Tax=Takifugu rubripes TaxID=31033 RepID=A0A3B5KKP4_TAKRU|nr:28S ribosomal protein S11, mitochondrial [Takifugu rubripes]|eukprot:XP_003969460.1 PREDICTED: 28S ribosomal protein S11, mitochondrial [Takifugu rubripes]